MAVTLRDVAELAGVSPSAVSRTFTAGASVSEKTRQKVESAAKTLGYQPNFLASSLATGRTKLIALVSDNFRNPIFLQVFDLFTRGLQDRGLRPLLVNLTDEDHPGRAVDMVQQYNVDGVIVASSTLPPSFAESFRQAGIPVVHSFGRYTRAPDVHVVGIDNRYCGVMAAETLLARGYTKLGFLGGPQAATSTQDRFAGFSEVLNAAKGVQFSYSYAEAYSFAAGRLEMQRLIENGPAQAYFCGDDVLSIGALSALQSAGLSAPQDIGIIGLNDMEMSGWENIDLTTIHQPIRQIITSSVELIVGLITEPDSAPETRLFRCRITERGTLRPLPQPPAQP